MINKLLKIFIILAAAALWGYMYREPLLHVYAEVYAKYFPCQKPITYTIGSFDPRFGISKSDFLAIIQKSENLWEKPVGKKLFQYVPQGELKINLIYDERQAATEKLKSLGLVVSENKTSYEEVKAKYTALQSDYLKQKALYETRVDEFDRNKKTYDAEVEYWNAHGGAPQDAYARLQSEREALQVIVDDIHRREAVVNSLVSNINATVVVLNRLAEVLNLDVAKFNEIGKERGKEFTAGLYESNANGQSISIYQYDNSDKLVRVLAHELGHAIGLEHLPNPKAIMYYLNEGGNGVLTQDDLNALKDRCRIK